MVGKVRDENSRVINFSTVSNAVPSFTCKLTLPAAGQGAITSPWSPTRDLIAFTSDVDGDFEIYTIHSDGSELKRLTHLLTDEPFEKGTPTWAPRSVNARD